MSTPTLSNNFLEETADALLLIERLWFYHQPKMAYEVGGVSKESFEAMMGWMYANTLTITPKNFDDILSAAQFLGCAVAEKLEKMTFLVKISQSVQLNGMETIYCPWIEPNNEMD